jgi:hypothetical protein
MEKSMSPQSFTVIAYETAPRCIEEIGRLRRLFKISFNHKEGADISTLKEAFESLDTMSEALSEAFDPANPDDRGLWLQ